LFKNDKKKLRIKEKEYLNNNNKREVTIKPTLDIVFKRLFDNKDNKDILVHFYSDDNDNEISNEDINLWIKFLNNRNDQIFRNEDIEDVYKKARYKLLLLQDDEEFKKEYNRRIHSVITENSTRISVKREGIKLEKKEELLKLHFSISFQN